MTMQTIVCYTRRSGFAVALLLLAPLALCVAQEEPVATSDPARARADFDAVYGEWKAVLTQLKGLHQEFLASSDDERKRAIRKQYTELIEEGKELEPKLLAAAEAAYVAESTKDRELLQFLYNRVAIDVDADRYESAFKLATMLLNDGPANKALENLAGIAAFVTNHYDAAREHFKKAGSKLSETGRNFKSVLGKYPALWEREQKLRAAEAKADDLPRVKFETSQGDIVLELFENEAPNTTANMISLVEKKYYDGLVFHRVLPGFMAQGGRALDGGGPGYTIPCECAQENHRVHFRGSLSMAHAGSDTGGSQFFLTFAQAPHLDGDHTVFGRVIEGMDVLARIRRSKDKRGTSTPGFQPDKIIKATVVRKRDHAYVPVKSDP